MKKIAQHIIDEIFLNIKELADKRFQYQAWVLAAVPNYVSSFVELNNVLKSGLATDYVLDQGSEGTGLSENLIAEMKKMMALLWGYKEGKKTDKHILEDPEWDKVVAQAKIVMELYNKEKNSGFSYDRGE